MVKKIGLKIPKILVNLGDAIEVKGNKVHYYFDNGTKFLTTPDGKTIWCIHGKESDNYSKITDIYSKSKTNLDKGLSLWDCWNDGKSDTPRATILDAPNGFLFQIDKCHTIVYESDKWTGKKRRYIHDFETNPAMSVNKTVAPSVLKLSGGKIRVTKRGIEG